MQFMKGLNPNKGPGENHTAILENRYAIGMNILMIGGTRFVGRHLVEEAIRKGHTVTLFNRGTNENVFPELELIKGDRNKDVELLSGRSWDAVIDTCGYFPGQVDSVLSVLKDRTEHYTFISSISVYADQTIAFQDESSALASLEDESVEEVTGETYGGLKVLCEQVAENLMPDKLLTVRPGLIVGPHDSTDRFTYWPSRIARGGEVLAPDKPENDVQFIDVRDLASWTIKMIETKQTGAYNLVTTPETQSFGDLLTACKDASQSDAQFQWVKSEFLLEQDVQPWMGLPLWVTEDLLNFMKVSNQKALDAGLMIRPLIDTVKDTLEWARSLPDNHEPKAGISLEKESDVLKRWRAQKFQVSY